MPRQSESFSPTPPTSPALPPSPILVVVPWSQGGGAQGALVQILRQLPRERVIVVILFGGNRNHDAIQQNAGRVIEFDEPRTPAGIWRARRRLRPLVESALVVYSLMRGSHLVLGMLPARTLRSIDLVTTFHQLPSQDASGTQGRVEDAFVRRAVGHSALVTAPAASAVTELKVGKYAPTERIVLEPNGIAVGSHDAPEARAGELDELRLVFAGRLSEQKGLDRIPELLNASDIPIRLRIIGDGEERELVDGLAAQISDLHHVEVIGHTDAIVEHLDWSDAVFLPSRWELNPLIIWEARARGRGTIASDIRPLLDLASSGPMWFFDSPDGFASIVQRLVSHEAVRATAHTDAIASASLLEGTSRIVEHLTR
jgi:glycosyltransferase involved in cell wall biosynthesis